MKNHKICERDNSVLSSDLCNYIPAVPSWWEICRFWSSLESSSEICWRVEDYLLVNTFSLFDLTTPPPKAMKWMAIWSYWIVQNGMNWSHPTNTMLKNCLTWIFPIFVFGAKIEIYLQCCCVSKKENPLRFLTFRWIPSLKKAQTNGETV